MESEPQTRKKRIDTKLRDADWEIVPFHDGMELGALTNHAVEDFPTANGPADYALVSAGQLLGIIEAKKVTVDAKGVLVPAERYSKGVSDSLFHFDGAQVPLLYSTNGEIIYFRDVRHPLNTSRELSHFHTPGALTELLAPRPASGRGEIGEHDRIDEEMVAVLANKTEAERLRIAWGMWRSARRMIERMVASQNRDLSPEEQHRIVASRMSHGT